MKVSEIMHRGVTSVTADTPVRQVAQKMRHADIGAVPVRADDRLLGMVTDRDITCRVVAEGRDADATTARDVMTPVAITCSPEDDVEHAIAVMEGRKVRRLPVLDDAGRLVGMVSLGDISNRVDEDESGELLREVSAHHA